MIKKLRLSPFAPTEAAGRVEGSGRSYPSTRTSCSIGTNGFRFNKSLQRLVLLVLLAIPPIYASINTKYIKETKEDIEQALVNFPERVPAGPEVMTKAGPQLTQGDVPDDFARNKEIYNDILTVQNALINLMKLILSANVNRNLLPDVELQMNNLIALLAKLGVRYSLEEEFDILIKQLASIMQEIKTVSPSADFMLFKALLEVILAEIENSIRTKLVD